MSSRTAALRLVRRTWIVTPEVSASLPSSVSMRAIECQLPATSSSIAKSEPSAVMRLSLMLPPQSATILDKSWTRPMRSSPMAEIAMNCFIREGKRAWRPVYRYTGGR